MVTIYLTYVLVEVIGEKAILLGQITVFLLCRTVLGQDVLALVQVETGQNIHTAETSKDSHLICILDQHAIVGSITDILQEHLI